MTLLLRTVLNKTELLKTLSNRTISFGFACNDNGAVVSNSGSPSVSVHDDLMTPLTSKVTVQSSMCQVRICQHYQKCKASAPFSTSACIVVPEHWQYCNSSCMAWLCCMCTRKVRCCALEMLFRIHRAVHCHVHTSCRSWIAMFISAAGREWCASDTSCSDAAASKAIQQYGAFLVL